MTTFFATPEKHSDWLRDILRRCGRRRILETLPDGKGWLVRDEETKKIVDWDTGFDTLFYRHYDWEEDVPGFEGLLWWSLARLSGEVCLKGTRIPAKMIKAYIVAGDDPLKDWEYITKEQIEAVKRYQGD